MTYSETNKYEPEYGSVEWENKAVRIAACYAPETYPCRVCNFPVVKGYCCDGCGSVDPSNPNFE